MHNRLKTYTMVVAVALLGALGGALASDTIVSGALVSVFRQNLPLVVFVVGVPIWFVALLVLDIAVGDLTFPIPGSQQPMKGAQSQVMWFVVLMVCWAICIKLLAPFSSLIASG